MSVYMNPLWPWPVCVGLGLALLAFSWWTYPRGSPGRLLMLGLRFAAILLVLFALLRPALVFSEELKQSSTLVVLVDNSRSMALRDMWAGKSRWEVLQTILAESHPAFEELEKEVKIRVFEFSRQVKEPANIDAPPEGERTALGEALQDVLRRTSGERLAGVIVMTDGASNAGISPLQVAKELAGLKAPIYPVGFGQPIAGDQVRDVAAERIVAPAQVHKKNKFTVRGEFSLAGFANRAINVRLLLNDVEKAVGVLKVEGDAKKGVIDISAIAEQPGDLKVTLVADEQPGELQKSNNAVSTFISVLADGVSVLQVEGKYRFWEPKFVRWALDQSPDIELTQLFLLDTAGNAAEIPPEVFQPGRFDVIILGDLPANRLAKNEHKQLRELVSRGAGLLMIGGYEAFGPGGWGETPIAEMLPVVMRRADEQRKGDMKMMPTEMGMRHFILRLAGVDPQSNREAWDSLRPLDGGSTWTKLTDNALSLAETPEGVPLLAAFDAGAVRTLAFAGDTTWRWRKDKLGFQYLARFWRQLVLWLARKEEIGGAQVILQLDKRRVEVGQALPVLVKLKNPDGTVVPNGQVEVVVETPKGDKVPLPLIAKGDTFEGTFIQTNEPGDYIVRAQGKAGGNDIGSASAKFLAFDEDSELQQLAANVEMLRGLASATNGTYVEPVDFVKFVPELKKRGLNPKVTQPIYKNLWDRWELLAIFLASITAEWLVRKRRGLA